MFVIRYIRIKKNEPDNIKKIVIANSFNRGEQTLIFWIIILYYERQIYLLYTELLIPPRIITVRMSSSDWWKVTVITSFNARDGPYLRSFIAQSEVCVLCTPCSPNNGGSAVSLSAV